VISSLNECQKGTSFNSCGSPFTTSYVISSLSCRVERMVLLILSWVPPNSALQCSGGRNLNFLAVRTPCSLWQGSFWNCSMPFGVFPFVHCGVNRCNFSHVIMGYLLIITRIAEQTGNILSLSLPAVPSKVPSTECSLLACWHNSELSQIVLHSSRRLPLSTMRLL